MPTKQEEVFEGLAKEVCDSAIEGYNGIFIWNQWIKELFSLMGKQDQVKLLPWQGELKDMPTGVLFLELSPIYLSNRLKVRKQSLIYQFLISKYMVIVVTICLMPIILQKSLKIYLKLFHVKPKMKKSF